MDTYNDPFDLPDFDPDEDRSHPDDWPDTVAWVVTHKNTPATGIACTGSANERIAAFRAFFGRTDGVSFVINPEAGVTTR